MEAVVVVRLADVVLHFPFYFFCLWRVQLLAIYHRGGQNFPFTSFPISRFLFSVRGFDC